VLDQRTFINAEAYLTTPAVVIADTADAPRLGAACLPRRGRGALRSTEERHVATAGVGPAVIWAAAVVR